MGPGSIFGSRFQFRGKFIDHNGLVTVRTSRDHSDARSCLSLQEI